MKKMVLRNVFIDNAISRVQEHVLVEKAQSGNLNAIKELIRMHESWIFNISLRMTGNMQDAEDATQEILMKMLTKLSTFENKSAFRTWLYRLVRNHVLNMKRSQIERFFLSFEKHKDFIHESDVLNVRSQYTLDPSEEMLVGAIKDQCMMGMLLCLDRTQRLIIILTFILGVSPKIGSEIMDTSRDRFRQDLHRARTQLKNYMNENCGLINKKNTCSCARKTRKAINAGIVDPKTDLFKGSHVEIMKDIVKQRLRLFETMSVRKIRELFLQSPFVESDSVYKKIEHLL